MCKKRHFSTIDFILHSSSIGIINFLPLFVANDYSKLAHIFPRNSAFLKIAGHGLSKENLAPAKNPISLKYTRVTPLIFITFPNFYARKDGDKTIRVGRYNGFENEK